ncbi:MAG TPA: signal peptidase II [Clostridiales bacterium]|nr:signal peptidase II [Clostridiales bacterium]
MGVQNKITFIAVIILVAIEQIIKVIINNNFLSKKFSIIPPFLYFEPMFNKDYSWINSMLQLGIGKWVHIIIVSAMTILIFLFYLYISKRFGSVKLIDTMFAFLLSGAICSLIDKIFWNGSLDYILLKGFFTFDLKDVYINVFIVLVILSIILNNKVIKQIDDRVFIDFIKYVLRR